MTLLLKIFASENLLSINYEQKDNLIMLVESNFIMLLGRHATVTGVKDKAAVWQDIANRLNAMGPHKTVKQWSKVLKKLNISWNFIGSFRIKTTIFPKIVFFAFQMRVFNSLVLD